MTIQADEYKKICKALHKLIEKNQEIASPLEIMTILVSTAFDICLQNAPSKDEAIHAITSFTNFTIEQLNKE